MRTELIDIKSDLRAVRDRIDALARDGHFVEHFDRTEDARGALRNLSVDLTAALLAASAIVDMRRADQRYARQEAVR